MVRLATPADAGVLADMLARAFHDDPVSVWSHPDPRKRPRRLVRFFAGRLRTLVPQEMTWTADDGQGAAISSVRMARSCALLYGPWARYRSARPQAIVK